MYILQKPKIIKEKILLLPCSQKEFTLFLHDEQATFTLYGLQIRSISPMLTKKVDQIPVNFFLYIQVVKNITLQKTHAIYHTKKKKT